MVFAAATHGIDLTADIFVFFELLRFPGKVFFGGKRWGVFFCCDHGVL